MMTRLNALFFLSPTAMTAIALIGAITALFAATIALVQTDIKKVLAYSTVSQLGFMVLACGVGAFDAGVFHLLTHACFKALLFLAAGSVIVAMHHKQDIFEMGGLAKFLPITHKVFLVGVLAIIGFPGFSGFFSKDEILWRSFIFPDIGWLLWSMSTLAAICTAFYMVRLLCLTFYGNNRSDKHTQNHLHETSSVMWAPLVVLAFMSFFIGYLGIPEFLAESFGTYNFFAHYLEPVIHVPKHHNFWAFTQEHHSRSLEWTMMILATGLGLTSASIAYILYRKGPSAYAETLRVSYPRVYTLLLNKYGVDEIYAKIFIRPLKDMADFLWRVMDVKVINGSINTISKGLMSLSGLISLQDSGSMQRYAAVFVLGFVGLIFLVIS
jgi:NADH-quinone oxidoreductase subunit L